MAFNILFKTVPLTGYARLDFECVATKERKVSPFVARIEKGRKYKTFEIVGWIRSAGLYTVDDEDDIMFDYDPSMTPIAERLIKGIPEITIAKRLLDKKILCAGCDKMVSETDTKLCSCRHIRYCGRECQVAHWKVHKSSCTYKK